MNRSTLVKLGALGTALYFANKNKSAKANSNNVPATVEPSKDSTDSKATSPFMLGKELAGKFFGRK